MTLSETLSARLRICAESFRRQALSADVYDPKGSLQLWANHETVKQAAYELTRLAGEVARLEFELNESKKEVECGGPDALCYSADYGFGLCRRHMAAALAESAHELKEAEAEVARLTQELKAWETGIGAPLSRCRVCGEFLNHGHSCAGAPIVSNLPESR